MENYDTTISLLEEMSLRRVFTPMTVCASSDLPLQDINGNRFDTQSATDTNITKCSASSTITLKSSILRKSPLSFCESAYPSTQRKKRPLEDPETFRELKKR